MCGDKTSSQSQSYMVSSLSLKNKRVAVKMYLNYIIIVLSSLILVIVHNLDVIYIS